MNLKTRMLIWILQAKYLGLTILTPAIAARFALKRFLTPPRHQPPAAEKAVLQEARLEYSPFFHSRLPVWRWGHSKHRILLVHGWGGRGGQLRAFVQPLLDAGFEVITFDGPAHGQSRQRQTTMIEFADAIVSVAQHVGSLHGIIAHSFGAACTSLAMHYGLNVPHSVLIGCPYAASDVINDFGKALNLSEKVIRGMRRRLRQRYKNSWRWEDMNCATLLAGGHSRILIIHDLHDKEVAYADAGKIISRLKHSSLLTTHHLGHRRILKEPAVIERVVKEMTTPGRMAKLVDFSLAINS